MEFSFLIFIFFLASLFYFLFTSYSIQVFMYKKRFRKELREAYVKQVRGRFEEDGFFSSRKRVISKKGYANLGKRHKVYFIRCYNIIHFKTQDADWELFFHLEKEGILHKEIMTLKIFPNRRPLRSQASIEKLHNRLNILANNRYLTAVLEENDTRQILSQLLQKPGDVMNIEAEMLSMRRDMKAEAKLTEQEFLDMVEIVHKLKNKVFRSGTLEY